MDSSNLRILIGHKINLPGHFDEPVILEEARALGVDGSAGFECRVRLQNGTLEESVISSEEAAALIDTHQEPSDSTSPVDAEKLRLLIESSRIRLAFAHDTQFAVSLSGIRTLPHQIEAVYQKMLPQPRLRFLLADDPGAGKTIMAGLLIKELKLRQVIERVLILCPAPLTIQWQDELLRWFGEPFDIIFSAVDQQQLTNPWQRASQAIASIDYAKQEGVRERIWEQQWDLVIVDEAHKCSARTAAGGQGRESRIVATKRYDLVSRLSSNVDHLLLLTATPHHGDEDKFAHFLRLIDPDLFPEPHRFGNQASEIRKEIFRLGDDCPWALRRLKEDLRDIKGRRLFPDRHVSSIKFSLNDSEFALYKTVTAYINKFIPQRTGRRKTTAALTRIVFQRRLASSTNAIHESIKRRLQKQQDLLEELEQLSPSQRSKRLAALQGRIVEDIEQEDDDLDEASQELLVDEYTAAMELDQLREEIAALKELVEQARKVREQANDSKLAALKQCLTQAQFQELVDGRGKLLIFTEHRDTLSYVLESLEQWGYTTCQIHGGMNPHERKRAQEQFRTAVQICVATEAAGEGINLQFCHLMINYDMPWNPTRLEQRLGRIHRIGQERDVYMFNFLATESDNGDPIIEGRILQRLLEKLEQMKDALGGRVFDVIGEVLSINDVNLVEMLREAAYDPKRLDEYIDQIDRIDPEKLKSYEEATGIALARSHVDFSGFQTRNLEAEERHLMPRYVEEHFIEASKEVGLRVEPRADGLWRVEHVLADLRADRLESVRKVGKAEHAYRKITFHKDHLEENAHIDAVLMGPGHPLYAAVDEKLNERLAFLTGHVGVFFDPMAETVYWLHFFEVSIKGKNANGGDVPLYGELVTVKEEAGVYEILPTETLLNLPAHPHPPDEINVFDYQGASDFLKSGYQLECRTKVQKERQHFADVVRKHLEKSFAIRINRAQEKAMALDAKAGSKPEYKLTADEARRYVDELQRSRDERLAGLKRLEIARTGPVRHVGSGLVLPRSEEIEANFPELADEPEPSIQRQSELAAEDVAIASLMADGFPEGQIEKVGHQKIGFDIRAHRVIDTATGELDVRRVEVKGRIPGQPIRLTTNEWLKAQQLKDSYWLYVVWGPLTENPELVRIQNPAERLDHAKREILATKFFEIPAEAIIEN